MSYKLDRIMSLGSFPGVAQGLKLLNLREPGPVDWAYNTNRMTSCIQLFTGDLFKSVLKRNFYSRTYEECINYQCPGADEFIWSLENLDDFQTYKRLVSRFCKLEEHVRKGGKFIYLTTKSETYKSIDTFYYLIETMLPYFKKDDILIITDSKDIPSYCNSFYVKDIDRNNQFDDYWKELIHDSLKDFNI